MYLNERCLPPDFVALPQTQDAQQPGNGLATAVWAPPQPALETVVDFADNDLFEVQVLNGDRRLVAAVELVSPANKDRPQHRRDFAIKCASYLQQRIAVVIVDVVTERQELHDDRAQQLEVWPHALAVGEGLPTLPLWIGEDIAVPLDLAAAYRSALGMVRLQA